MQEHPLPAWSSHPRAKGHWFVDRITTGTPIDAALNASVEDNFEEILRHSRLLDAVPGDRKEGLTLTESMLRIRNRAGETVPLAPNVAQQEYERQRGLRNI